MKFIDWFAGIGGFRFGMEQAGHECVGFCEKDEDAIASYTLLHLATEEERNYVLSLPRLDRATELLKEKYRHNEWFAKDIQDVQCKDVPDADIWCFGAPCTDFSMWMYNRKGLKGAHSSLVKEIFRLLEGLDEEHKPKWLLYENVEGMLSSHRGFDFGTILIEMEKLGYDIEWQVLNSKDWGVPQSRRRTYVIGHLRGEGGRQILPFKISSRNVNNVGLEHDIQIKVKEPNSTGYSLAEQGDIINFAFPRSKNRRGRVGRKIANTLDHHAEQYVIEYLGKDPKPNAIEFTMDGEQFYTCIRKLTGIECMRLQGLDYNNAKLLSEIHSDFVLYKQAGNSVTIGIIYEIGRHMT